MADTFLHVNDMLKYQTKIIFRRSIMSIRFITGSSGQGKTSYIIDEVIERSRKNPDCQYYVIVPEQFSLEMQRNIAES